MALFGPLAVGDAIGALDLPLQPPSWRHLFGTTGQGQDVLAQTIVGARATLGIGFAVGLFVTLLGVLVGVGAGYAGGRVDDGASVVTNVFLVIPGLPLAIVIAAYLPPGALRLVLVLTIAGWAWCARVFRAETLSLRGKDFVAAARLAGERHWRIIAVEILPNMASLVAASFIGTTVYAIGAEVGLEFLGLGDLGGVTWGTNLYWASNDSALLTGAWWTFVPTGACVALVGFALTLVSVRARRARQPAPAPSRAAAAGRARRTAAQPTLSAQSLVSVRDLSGPPCRRRAAGRRSRQLRHPAGRDLRSRRRIGQRQVDHRSRALAPVARRRRGARRAARGRRRCRRARRRAAARAGAGATPPSSSRAP